MEPGQVAVQAGAWMGGHPGGVESQGLIGVEVPVSHKVAAVGWVGAQRHGDGTIDPRDATIGALWLPVVTDEWTVRLQPGLSIPTGGIGSGLSFRPLSTASVDPWLSADIVAGRAWVAGLSLVGRAPLYAGWDDVRQGPFLRVDLRGARRLGKVVVFAGPSAVRQAPGSPALSTAKFTELAATAGGVFHIAERWSMTAQMRVPAWVTSGGIRQVSGGLGARWVVGSPPEDHTH